MNISELFYYIQKHHIRGNLAMINLRTLVDMCLLIHETLLRLNKTLPINKFKP